MATSPPVPTRTIAGLATASTDSVPALDRLAYSFSSFCNAAEIGQTLAYDEIAAGRLKVVRVGRRTLIPVEAARAWLASLPEGVAGEPAAPRQARLARQRAGVPHAECDGLVPQGTGTPVGSDAPGSTSARARRKNSSIRTSRVARASS
jgi:hypothetical protein